jgi:hypothetical protein
MPVIACSSVQFYYYYYLNTPLTFHQCSSLTPQFHYSVPPSPLPLLSRCRAPANPSPMQYYISGTIAFLIIEMTAQFAYYRYINKHGGGTSSLIFLFVIATLSAARNSLSFFLLLIVCMGLSVVTQDLGGVMGRVRALTAGHFVFGGKSASVAGISSDSDAVNVRSDG